MGFIRTSVIALGVCISSTTVAAQNYWYSDTTSYSFSLSCTTGSGAAGVTPLPTSYDRFSETTYSSESMETALQSTIYVTATTTVTYPATSWSYITLRPLVTLPETTVRVSIASPITTLGTVTSRTVVCTNGVTPASTATLYTGTYVPIPQQNTTLPAIYPTSVYCVFNQTDYIHVWPTMEGSGTATSTITPSTVGTVTETSVVTYTWPTTVYLTTARVTARNYHLDGATNTVSTACEATPTMTYEARCAPQNLIAEMNDGGLDIGEFNPNFVFGGWYEMAQGDPSLCCQMCVENEGCVASVYWAQGGSCLLGYVGGEEKCPTAFTFTSGNTSAEVYWQPRLANIFQTGLGCGRIEYVGTA